MSLRPCNYEKHNDLRLKVAIDIFEETIPQNTDRTFGCAICESKNAFTIDNFLTRELIVCWKCIFNAAREKYKMPPRKAVPLRCKEGDENCDHTDCKAGEIAKCGLCPHPSEFAVNSWDYNDFAPLTVHVCSKHQWFLEVVTTMWIIGELHHVQRSIVKTHVDVMRTNALDFISELMFDWFATKLKVKDLFVDGNKSALMISLGKAWFMPSQRKMAAIYTFRHSEQYASILQEMLSIVPETARSIVQDTVWFVPYANNDDYLSLTCYPNQKWYDRLKELV